MQYRIGKRNECLERCHDGDDDNSREHAVERSGRDHRSHDQDNRQHGAAHEQSGERLVPLLDQLLLSLQAEQAVLERSEFFPLLLEPSEKHEFAHSLDIIDCGRLEGGLHAGYSGGGSTVQVTGEERQDEPCQKMGAEEGEGKGERKSAKQEPEQQRYHRGGQWRCHDTNVEVFQLVDVSGDALEQVSAFVLLQPRRSERFEGFVEP